MFDFAENAGTDEYKVKRFWYGCRWTAICQGDIEITCNRHCIETDYQLSGPQMTIKIAQSLIQDGYPPSTITIHAVYQVQPGSNFP